MSRKDWPDEKLFFRLLNNKSDNTYWNNIRILRTRPNKGVFETCITLSKSRKPKARMIAIDILAQLGLPPRPFYKETRRLLFEILRIESNSKVLISTLYAIGHNGNRLSTKEVILISSFMYHKNAGVRQGIVSALLGVDNKKAIDALIYLTADNDSSIRDWATFGVGTMINTNNKSIITALWKRVNDKNQDTKLEAILGLAKRKDFNIKEIIKRELLSGEYGTLLFEAIEELKDKDFLPLLQQHLKNARKNKGMNPEWINPLKDCISKISTD